MAHNGLRGDSAVLLAGMMGTAKFSTVNRATTIIFERQKICMLMDDSRSKAFRKREVRETQCLRCENDKKSSIEHIKPSLRLA